MWKIIMILDAPTYSIISITLLLAYAVIRLTQPEKLNLNNKGKTMTNFTCDGIRQTIQKGATLLDVRNVDEFNRGALPNAKNIPLSILPVLANERLDINDPVLIYCQAGARAVMAEKILIGLGFNNITNIGGIEHYQQCR